MKVGKFNIEVDKELKTPTQYSKRWTSRWQLFVMFWVSVYLGYDVVVNRALNINNVILLLISSIVGCIIPYFAKSFLETKEDKKMQLEALKLQNGMTQITNIDAINTELSNNEEVG